jgi:signal transduction histidine kinase
VPRLQSAGGVADMTAWPNLLNKASRHTVAAAVALLVSVIGYLDYITGPHISMSAFYLLPLSLAAWRLGARSGLVVAVVSVTVWIVGNLANGDADFTSPGLVGWNGGIQLISFVVVVFALARLRALQRNLEVRVQERAQALTREIAERERLQRDLLEVSEIEQRRIGQDLHDGLCQHLVGTALTCQALREELAEKGLREAERAQKIVKLIEEGVTLSRRSAKGLHPVEMDAEGLMLALEEFAVNTSKLFNVSCTFECESPVLIHDDATAGQFFRIAQEAVRNAINHGRAQTIVIQLNTLENGLELRIADEGIGLANAPPSCEGMGRRIMHDRACVIGAAFDVRSGDEGGTVVTCTLPLSAIPGNSLHEPANV